MKYMVGGEWSVEDKALVTAIFLCRVNEKKKKCISEF